MPFELQDKVDSLEMESEQNKTVQQQFRFLPFYEGLLIAADSLRQLGLSIELHTFDVPKESNQLQSILQDPEMSKVDLIIGLVYAGDFIRLAKFASENHIPLINPLTRRRESAMDNAWVIKMQPDESSRMEAVREYIMKSQQKHDFFISRQNKYQLSEESKAVSNIIFSLKTDKPSICGKVHTVVDSVARLKALISTAHNPIVFTLADNPAYVMDYLRKMSTSKDSLPISALYGLPDWDSMDKLETTHLERLNVHMLKALYPRYTHYSVENYISVFQSRYFSDPNELAFSGFDALWVTGQAFRMNPDDMIGYLKTQPVDGILARYSFRQIGEKGLENQFWNIYLIDDYKIKVVNR